MEALFHLSESEWACERARVFTPAHHTTSGMGRPPQVSVSAQGMMGDLFADDDPGMSVNAFSTPPPESNTQMYMYY